MGISGVTGLLNEGQKIEKVRRIVSMKLWVWNCLVPVLTVLDLER